MWTFLALTFFLTALFHFPSVILKVSENASSLFNTAAMWCPAIAALITKLLFKENINDLQWKWPTTKYFEAGSQEQQAYQQ